MFVPKSTVSPICVLQVKHPQRQTNTCVPDVPPLIVTSFYVTCGLSEFIVKQGQESNFHLIKINLIVKCNSNIWECLKSTAEIRFIVHTTEILLCKLRIVSPAVIICFNICLTLTSVWTFHKSRHLCWHILYVLKMYEFRDCSLILQ